MLLLAKSILHDAISRILWYNFLTLCPVCRQLSMFIVYEMGFITGLRKLIWFLFSRD